MDFIPYAQQSLKIEDIQAVMKSFGYPIITRGPQVEAFEKSLRKKCGAKYAVVFNSGTTALSAAYYAAKLSKEDTVFTSPNTFVGTVAYAATMGANLRFVDIDPQTGSPDFKKLTQAHSGRPFLVPVHFSGIAKKIKRPWKNAVIIEDACQAFGSTYLDGTPVGSCPESDMTAFSFHPAKTICTGEGGVVTTQSKEYYERLKLYRNNGIVKDAKADPWSYDVVDVTQNANFTDFQAALGLSQLQKVDSFIAHRERLAKRYRDQLKSFSWIHFLDERASSHSAHNLFVVLIDFENIGYQRQEIMHALKEKGVGTQVHFTPLYHHSYFKNHYGFREEDFPQMELYSRQALSLPMYSHLLEEQVDFVCRALIEYCSLQKTH